MRTLRKYVASVTVMVATVTVVLLVGTTYPDNANAHDTEECVPLVEEARKRHDEMRDIFNAYVELRQAPESDEQALGVLEAADYTIDEVMETLNQWLNVLVCAKVIAWTAEDDGQQEDI